MRRIRMAQAERRIYGIPMIIDMAFNPGVIEKCIVLLLVDHTVEQKRGYTQASGHLVAYSKPIDFVFPVMYDTVLTVATIQFLLESAKDRNRWRQRFIVEEGDACERREYGMPYSVHFGFEMDRLNTKSTALEE